MNEFSEGVLVQVALADGLQGQSAGFGVGGDDALDAWAGYGSRANGIDADAGLAEFHGQGFRQPHHGPLGGGIGGAQGKTHDAGAGRQINDGTTARRLQQWHRPAGAVELTVDIDGQGAIPVLRVDILHFARWTGDTGVIDQHVEAAEPGLGGVEKSVYIAQRGDVSPGRPGVGARCCKCFQRAIVDVANMYPRAIVYECLGDGEPNARRPCRDHDPQALHRYVHVRFPPAVGRHVRRHLIDGKRRVGCVASVV